MPKLIFRKQLWTTGARVVLVVTNVIVLLLCLAVFVTGLWARLSESSYLAITDHPSLTRTSVSVAVVGLCAVLLAVIGIIGALLLKSILGRVVLSVYAFVLVFLIATELAAGIAAIVSRGDLKESIKDSTNSSLYDHWYNHSNSSETWDHFQQRYECCGALNYTDYFSIFNDTVVPSSCCTSEAIDHGECADTIKFVSSGDLHEIYTQPCVDVVARKLRVKMLVLAVVAIVIGVLQSTGVVVSGIAIYVASRYEEKTFSYKKLKHRARSSGYQST